MVLLRERRLQAGRRFRLPELDLDATTTAPVPITTIAPATTTKFEIAPAAAAAAAALDQVAKAAPAAAAAAAADADADAVVADPDAAVPTPAAVVYDDGAARDGAHDDRAAAHDDGAARDGADDDHGASDDCVAAAPVVHGHDDGAARDGHDDGAARDGAHVNHGASDDGVAAAAAAHAAAAASVVAVAVAGLVAGEHQRAQAVDEGDGATARSSRAQRQDRRAKGPPRELGRAAEAGLVVKVHVPREPGGFGATKACSSTGDPHYKGWEYVKGRTWGKFDFMGMGTFNLATATLPGCGCQVSWQTVLAANTKYRGATSNVAVAMSVGGTSFIVRADLKLTVVDASGARTTYTKGEGAPGPRSRWTPRRSSTSRRSTRSTCSAAGRSGCPARRAASSCTSSRSRRCRRRRGSTCGSACPRGRRSPTRPGCAAGAQASSHATHTARGGRRIPSGKCGDSDSRLPVWPDDAIFSPADLKEMESLYFYNKSSTRTADRAFCEGTGNDEATCENGGILTTGKCVEYMNEDECKAKAKEMFGDDMCKNTNSYGTDECDGVSTGASPRWIGRRDALCSRTTSTTI